MGRDDAGPGDPWRVYDAQRVEIVVDLTDDTIVSAWITQVNG